MGDAAIDHIKSIPWAAALLQDPKWTRTRTASRQVKASGEDSLFAETLATDRTLRAFLSLRPTQEADGKLAYHEVVAVVDLGSGLNGFPQICHGGIAATLLDEICGVLIVLNIEKEIEKRRLSGSKDLRPDMSFLTAYLNTTYKRPIPTPSTILCTAKVERQDGRKLFIRATIEDGAGGIYTIGEAMFLGVKSML
ncbi:hypothetical protein CC86DRAFT_380458 [Ophiobolus disseminans]|uniref:Thioesterase domain-containing protein n=1 Tax=Ophiobolus disseminans TaxID=1469910 RepID=A0A6A7A5V6_9PLEO|nr:hypothetical protein CC86DRAFT_380458 [Ophiobolus disseminans]